MDVCVASSDNQLKISDIPTTYLMPDNKGDMYLFGIVEYILYGLNSDGKSEGHYRALTYRRGNATWYVTDDSPATTEKIDSDTKIVPALLVLIQNK